MTPPSNAGGEGREVLTLRPETLSRIAEVACLGPERLGWARSANVWLNKADAEAIVAAFSARENADDRAPALVEAAVAEADELLDMLRDECWDLRCFDIQTGGDDADVGWTVIGHWQAKPREREIAQGWSDDPRVALREARKTLRTTPSQEASNVG